MSYYVLGVVLLRALEILVVALLVVTGIVIARRRPR
jgi:cytochrome b subunit of formate dehydrogenase